MQTSPIPIGDHRKQVRYQQIQRADRARNPKLRKQADKGAFPRGTGARERVPNRRASAGALHPSNQTAQAFQQLRDDVARRARVVPLDPNASVLVIETAITDNAPPFNQPWPPTGLGDGWHAVDQFSTPQNTFWRRIRLEHARPSPSARPIHR